MAKKSRFTFQELLRYPKSMGGSRIIYVDKKTGDQKIIKLNKLRRKK